MIRSKYISSFIIIICLSFMGVRCFAQQHTILFCGEKIPVDNSFVSEKLMNVIKAQIPNVKLAELRQRIKTYFPIVEYYLRATGLPDDFKYLPIVESGFKNLISGAGAAGFWQLMPETAEERGLIVNQYMDERNDIHKSTHAACKVLADYYLGIRKKYGISSWVLTAATYNFGPGNMSKVITKNNKNYFEMDLNEETANYVYKIIAVKELFEYPELYVKNFGYNIFAGSRPAAQLLSVNAVDQQVFSSMKVSVVENDGKHPDTLRLAPLLKKGEKIDKNSLPVKDEQPGKIIYVAAEVNDKYKDFKDGDNISFKLQENLKVGNRFTGKGNIIQGRGWIIDDRIMVDLGYDRDVLLYDMSLKAKGISFSSLKKKKTVILKVISKES